MVSFAGGRSDERAAEVSNVVDILASQKTPSPKSPKSKKTAIDDVDLAALLDVANQLDAMLGKVDTLATDVSEFNKSSKTPAAAELEDAEDPLASAFADFDESDEVVEEADGAPVTDISALLANQNYTPLDTEHLGLDDGEEDAESDGDDEEEFDLSISMDVANQLNSALDDSAENDDDLASA